MDVEQLRNLFLFEGLDDGQLGQILAAGEEVPFEEGTVLFVEGEEEFGSESLDELLETYKETLRSDVIVIADSGNWDIGVPALTTSLRGLVNCFVEVSTLSNAVHSGMFGGAVPDALTVLAEDDGQGSPLGRHEERGADGRGHGLIGMRERVGMVGGVLVAGPRPGGGFRISATLPLDGGD